MSSMVKMDNNTNNKDSAMLNMSPIPINFVTQNLRSLYLSNQGLVLNKNPDIIFFTEVKGNEVDRLDEIINFIGAFKKTYKVYNNSSKGKVLLRLKTTNN